MWGGASGGAYQQHSIRTDKKCTPCADTEELIEPIRLNLLLNISVQRTRVAAIYYTLAVVGMSQSLEAMAH